MTDSTDLEDHGRARPTLQQERSSLLSTEDQASKSAESKFEQPPISVREFAALLSIVILADLTIYRGHGYAGLALLLITAPLLLAVGSIPRRFDRSGWVLVPLLMLASIRLVWCGSPAAVVAGCSLLCGYAMSLSGLRPYVLQAIVFMAHLVSAGHRALHHYARSFARFSPNLLRANWVALLLPLVTLIVFGTIFILANPDLVKSFSSGLTWVFERIEDWVSHFYLTEILFCLAATWLTVGLLRPDVSQVAVANESIHIPGAPERAPLYEAFRNTLVMLISLFAVYLVFEFQTLWFRRFPKGFHFSGYAHEGAAWLTIALGLATLLLSMIFRGRILDDPRQRQMRRLSWIWSIENLLLAVSVFNRLFIYVGFNGMTRMRVIGMLGVAAVVGGFLLVLRKIARNYDFVWLIRHQLWTVAFAGFLYAVMPVDAFVNEYNVRRILAGDPAPSVQISVHPTSAEGLLRLKPLLDCDDPIIHSGIRALLADRLAKSEVAANQRAVLGWTAYQLAEERLLQQLRSVRPSLGADEDPSRHEAALEEFRRYAYQWY